MESFHAVDSLSLMNIFLKDNYKHDKKILDNIDILNIKYSYPNCKNVCSNSWGIFELKFKYFDHNIVLIKSTNVISKYKNNFIDISIDDIEYTLGIYEEKYMFDIDICNDKQFMNFINIFIMADWNILKTYFG